MAGFPPVFGDLIDRYMFRDALGNHILCWDLGRFMNHSCEPTCLNVDADFDIAVRDIPAGEELTDDYAGLHLQDHEEFDCCCGVPSCRGRVTPRDAFVLAAEWERDLHDALLRAADVPQPLRPVITDPDLRKVLDAVPPSRPSTPSLMTGLGGNRFFR